MYAAVQLRLRAQLHDHCLAYFLKFKFDFDNAFASNSVVMQLGTSALSDYLLENEFDLDHDFLTDSFCAATFFDSTFDVELGCDYDFGSGWVVRTCWTTLPFPSSAPTATSCRAWSSCHEAWTRWAKRTS